MTAQINFKINVSLIKFRSFNYKKKSFLRKFVYSNASCRLFSFSSLNHCLVDIQTQKMQKVLVKLISLNVSSPSPLLLFARLVKKQTQNTVDANKHGTQWKLFIGHRAYKKSSDSHLHWTRQNFLATGVLFVICNTFFSIHHPRFVGT